MARKYNKSRNNINSTSDVYSKGWKKSNKDKITGITNFESYTSSVSNTTSFNKNYNVNYSIDLNYGNTLKFLFIFALVILMSSFVLNDGFDKVFIDNSINESISVVDGYSYNINYTFYDWTKKFSILKDLKNIFDIKDALEMYESFDLYFMGENIGPSLFSVIYIIIDVPIRVLRNIIYDIYVLLRFIVTW